MTTVQLKKHFSILTHSKLVLITSFLFFISLSATQLDDFFSRISQLVNSAKIMRWSEAILFSSNQLNLFQVTSFEFYVYFFVWSGVLFALVTIFNFIFLSYLGLYGSFVLSLIGLFLFWISTLAVFSFIITSNQFIKVNFGSWFNLTNNLTVSLDFYVDVLSISYVLLVLTISIFVQLYAFSYFRYEPLTDRLVLFLNSFIISMIVLVTAGNLIILFLGWEMIGLTSFALINFWVTRKGTLKAAYKAFVFNKFSDASFLMFLILFFVNFYELDLCVINAQAYLLANHTFTLLYYDVSIIEILCAFIIFTAFIKSAQFGGHLWLPDSMEAPVPASALIHSATLVSAGLFLLLRFNVLFELSNYVYYVIPFIGALTGFYGGIGAAFQSDIKRILAYSTISHCGFLIISFSTYMFDYTLFYLYVHGFFKAGVFLCVGNIIRFGSNYQDFRRMGQFSKYLPFECLFAAIGLFNLAGLPFSLGFYMKHLFFVSFNANFFSLSSVIFIFCVLGALTGVFYSFRLYYYVFFDFKKAKKITYIKSLSNNLISQFYSNTSLASNVAIIGLFFSAYAISAYVYFVIKSRYLPVADYFLTESSGWLTTETQNFNFLWNVSYLNWFIVINIASVSFNYWRKLTSNNLVYKANLNTILFCLNSVVCLVCISCL